MRIDKDSSAYSESFKAWWRHQMETYSALLAICAGNSPVPGEFPAQRQVTLSFDVFFDLHLNKWLRKQSWGWWFETPLHPLWRHSNGSGVYQLGVPQGQGDSSAPSTTDPLIGSFCLVTTDGRLRTDRQTSLENFISAAMKQVAPHTFFFFLVFFI